LSNKNENATVPKLKSINKALAVVGEHLTTLCCAGLVGAVME